MQKSDFNYHLPTHLIAQKPLAYRVNSRLLCMHKTDGHLKDCHFVDFVGLLNKNDLLILNDTKVMPARLYGHKKTGGKLEILLEKIIDEQHVLAHIRASKSPKTHTLLTLDDGFVCEVMGRDDDLFRLQFKGKQNVLEILAQIGHIPLPPYMTRADDGDDVSRYQTVFAKRLGAVAAPTAGLHFDQIMLDKIQQKGITTAFVTLHVGSGTFQPVRAKHLADHIMHQEYYTVPQSTVDAVHSTRAKGGRIIAVGTTVVRALESASNPKPLQARQGNTDLFITPGYRFAYIDALLTNFHLPESTLLMLVCAFAGYQHTMQAYQHAIKQQYRFFSYGDAMFLADFSVTAQTKKQG